MSKMLFHPLASLHVAVTEGYNARISRLLRVWKQNWMSDECRRIWLRLKFQANVADRNELKNAIKTTYGRRSYVYKALNKMEQLCNELCVIQSKDIYYKSFHER